MREGAQFQTDVPERMDRLTWSRLHWLVDLGSPGYWMDWK
jgi:hypothetical protein